MKIAIVYNRESKRVINLFGVPNREVYGLKAIKRITDALKAGGHQVIALEGDKDLLDRLEEFMPRVIQGERPGMVFNLSYGIQGQARYTHVPGMLEMAGIPYVGSGPLAHSLALDKVVAKMLFKQEGIPTPDFAVLKENGGDLPDLPFPLIVKPRNEAVSFGIKVVNTPDELREASGVIFEKFQQPVLVERYIEGMEVNVGLLGNNPPEAFPPAELVFSEGGPQIYTYEDKTRKSGRTIDVVCPARIPPDLATKVQNVAREAFAALGCYDCSRVDMRIDKEGNPYVLEINSLPSLGEHGSYVAAAEKVGLDFQGLINRLVEVASSRYFGTPRPPLLYRKQSNMGDVVFSYLTERRDWLEKRVRDWTEIPSRTADPVGIRTAVKEVEKKLSELNMKPAPDYTNDLSVWTWETIRGFEDGMLFVAHIDVPLEQEVPRQAFRRDPELLFGEGAGCSRAPLAMLEFALSAVRHARRLRHLPLGVLVYGDEGRDCRYSGELIRAAAARAGQVLVLHAGSTGGHVITQRRGRRKYRLTLEGSSRPPGKAYRKPEVFLRVADTLRELAALTSRKDYVSVSPVDVRTAAYPMVLPHRASVTLLMTYLEKSQADPVEEKMREILARSDLACELDLISDRPPMKERKSGMALFKSLKEMAAKWDIPLAKESSVWPSAAGLVPRSTPVVCGIGPVAVQLYSPQEAVQRISLMQRTLLLAQFLAEELKPDRQDETRRK